MAILSYLRLRTKLAVLLALSVATVLAVAFISATALRTQMEADRIDKLKAVTESATSVLEGLESKVQAGRLSRAEALAVFADYVHSVRFDGDAGYLVLVSDDGTVLLHGLNREVEGRPMSPRDASGTSILGPIMKIVQSGHPDTISYLYPKPGTNVPAS
ncbi:MAG: cache domain-containing protein, partial [Rhodospirillales bacterium]|nr:cache domain-containing protein [Rhodospirillales bacterium]